MQNNVHTSTTTHGLSAGGLDSGLHTTLLAKVDEFKAQHDQERFMVDPSQRKVCKWHDHTTHENRMMCPRYKYNDSDIDIDGKGKGKQVVQEESEQEEGNALDSGAGLEMSINQTGFSNEI
jgi:hypothetical protein